MAIKRDEFNVFVERVSRTHKANPGMRFGQVLFNELEEIRPVLATELRGSPVDPYYSSDTDSVRNTVALEWLKENWEGKSE